ncbi:hypothetical protein J6S88_05845 [bacterium]|nr:hypothetical protein [bacterium]
MKILFRAFLILFYLCLAIFITPNENYNVFENTKNQEKAVLRHFASLNREPCVAPLSNTPLKTFVHAFGSITKVSRISIISQTKSDIITINKINEHYFVSPSHPEKQLLNSTNKNSDFSFGFNNSILTKNLLKYLLFIKNTDYLCQLSYNTPLKLENSVYTRAP